MRVIAILISVVWVGLDQLLKAYTVANVPREPQTTEVIPNFLALTYTTNTGAAWSLFSSGTVFLSVLRVVAGLAILAYLWTHPRLGRVQTIAWALVAGGAIGNAIDGFTRGYVVDMLLSHTLTAVYRPIFGTVYPIFNLADVGVVSGVLLLIISSLFAPRKPHHANA